MAPFKRGRIWWYTFTFFGRTIRESSKSTSKTIALKAEQQHRRRLEEGFLNISNVRRQRVRCLKDIIAEYLAGYRLRNRSVRFAEYALGHVSRLLGEKWIIDIDETVVFRYQEDRLRETAAPKSINEEVRFLLKIMGDSGDTIRRSLQRKRSLKLAIRKRVGKVFDDDETARLVEQAKKSRSPHMYPAFMLARNAGLRDAEIRTLSWGQINLKTGVLQVGQAKTEAGTGRIVPLNSVLCNALHKHRDWYVKKFGCIRGEWYLFPFGKPMPSDPTRHVTTLKSAWTTMRRNAKVRGRWHDNRHTLITELAETGVGDQTIMEIVGHVDRRMLQRYSHIRMQARRAALESVLEQRGV